MFCPLDEATNAWEKRYTVHIPKRVKKKRELRSDLYPWTRQDKGRKDKRRRRLRQNKPRQDKTRKDKSNIARQIEDTHKQKKWNDMTMIKTRQDKTRQDKERQE